MYMSKNTNDYEKITSGNYTDILNEYDNMTLFNCTKKKENKNDIMQTLLLTIRSGLSFLCVTSLKIYTLNKPLKEFK